MLLMMTGCKFISDTTAIAGAGEIIHGMMREEGFRADQYELGNSKVKENEAKHYIVEVPVTIFRGARGEKTIHHFLVILRLDGEMYYWNRAFAIKKTSYDELKSKFYELEHEDINLRTSAYEVFKRVNNWPEK